MAYLQVGFAIRADFIKTSRQGTENMKGALRQFDREYSQKERHERQLINYTNRKAPLIPAENQADLIDQQARRAWRFNVLPQKVAHGLGYLFAFFNFYNYFYTL